MPSETQTFEVTDDFDDLEQAVETFTKNPINNTIDAATPDEDDKVVQVEAFLSGSIRNPSFIYPKQDIASEEAIAEYINEGQEIIARDTIPDSLRPAYEASIQRRTGLAQVVYAMRRYNETKSPEDAAEYMRANIEAYGEPNEETYRSILQDKVSELAAKNKSVSAQSIYEELLNRLPVTAPDQKSERFKPSEETRIWMKEMVNELFGNLLRHAPETDALLGPEELAGVFNSILETEFGEAAAGWHAVVKPAKSVRVEVRDKEIIVPTDRAPVNAAETRRLIVHEIGIHVLRSIMGGETNLSLLKYGVSGYIDADEGLGKVMEQVVDDEFKEAGFEHYITAGLAYFDNADFRDAFEIKWRMKLLEDLVPGAEPTEEEVENARQWAVNSTLRIFRGTNELPLFKDLQYYNGSVEIWKYLESIRGDDFQLTLLLAGRINTSKEHQTIILESHSVD